jgi:hypothetical protein
MARAKSLFHSANHAINTLARLAARNAVKEQPRADGVRLTLVPPREINEQAQRYLADHRDELYQLALERAKHMGLIEGGPALSRMERTLAPALP